LVSKSRIVLNYNADLLITVKTLLNPPPLCGGYALEVGKNDMKLPKDYKKSFQNTVALAH